MLRISQFTHGMPSTYLSYSFMLNVIILLVIKVCTVVLFYFIKANKVFFQIMFTGYNIMFIMLLLLYSGATPTLSKLWQATILTGTKLHFIRELEWLRVMSNLYSGGSSRAGSERKGIEVR